MRSIQHVVVALARTRWATDVGRVLNAFTLCLADVALNFVPGFIETHSHQFPSLIAVAGLDLFEDQPVQGLCPLGKARRLDGQAPGFLQEVNDREYHHQE